ncbi:hypothetical protein SK128_006770 [Halocaridina rubra]|uniref:Uncharacterized protein n=1 Tax=Halocaridina rubra TaxID=373956 RepID=A0AAN9A5F4_HALRR
MGGPSDYFLFKEEASAAERNGFATGVGGFVSAKYAIDSQRREAMKVRERMRNSNTGEYEVKRTFTG